MKATKKLLAAVGVLAAASLVLAACGSNSPSSKSSGGTTTTGASGFNAAANNVVNPSTKAGGTLNLVATSDCDSWDPARTYYGWCWNMQRLFTRTLIGYQKVNGTSFKLAPDLATNMGVHNADYTKWTFTLKPGLKFSNGQPITPLDIKYAVSRLYATDVINGGPNFYYTTLLNAPSSYAGPYKSHKMLPDSAISTTANTITFHLKSSYADFDYLAALDVSAPVPAWTEGGKGYQGATYTKHPVSSGPFEIKSYTPNQSVDFVRNPNWKQSTDTIRHPLVNAVDLTIDTNSADADQKLKSGVYDAKADIPVDTTFQSQIMTSPSLKANADDPVSAAAGFLTVYPSVITNIDCRKAIFYATNKAALLQAVGGPTAGQIANTMTPPGISGNDTTSNPYPTGSDNTGDLAAAKSELKKCGMPNGFTTKMAYNTATGQNKALMQAEQTALARVGIKVTPDPSDASVYYTTFIGSPSNVKSQGIGISENGWGADFPTGYGFWFSIADGNAIAPTGNSNYPSLNIPTVNNVLTQSLSGKATAADFQKLDAAVMDSATYLPYRWDKNLYYRNPRMTNVTSDNALAFGIYDFVNVGVNGK